jgi:hypothetical protein
VNIFGGQNAVQIEFSSRLRDQTHRELVYRPLQFHKCSQLFICTHNETLSVAAVRVNNPDCSSFDINR